MSDIEYGIEPGNYVGDKPWPDGVKSWTAMATSYFIPSAAMGEIEALCPVEVMVYDDGEQHLSVPEEKAGLVRAILDRHGLGYRDDWWAVTGSEAATDRKHSVPGALNKMLGRSALAVMAILVILLGLAAIILGAL